LIIDFNMQRIVVLYKIIDIYNKQRPPMFPIRDYFRALADLSYLVITLKHNTS